jgi:lysophospholipase L1-like esterase
MNRTPTSSPRTRTIVGKIGLLTISLGLVTACSGSENSSNPGVIGGASAIVGGSSGLGAGGASTTLGGTSSVPTQPVGSGGTSSTSTKSSTSVTGGTTGLGGSVATSGGTSAKGGTSGKGGTTAGGGTTSSGGKSSSLGGSSTGGKSGTGGATTGGTTSTTGMHWVGTWSASPYDDNNNTDANSKPPITLTNSVVRQIAHVSLGGGQIRVQFSNLYSDGPLTIKSAHVALCKASPAVDSTIDTASDKALTFSGAETVTIAQGKEVWSDPIDFAVSNQGNVTVTTAFGSVPTKITQHTGSRTNSYFAASTSDVSAANMTSASKRPIWVFISGIDVMASDSASAVVAIGDSITDGRGTDTDKNNRWTDILAARLQGNASTANIAVLNQGIGGTALAGTTGTAAQARFARDVLGQSGVKYVIVLDGVNDIAYSNSTYATLKSAYDDLIKRSRDNKLSIYGATILPFGGNSVYSDAREGVRSEVNKYIKTPGVFDGYIDFDAALTDGGSPPKLLTSSGTTDGLHPGAAGYQTMGETPAFTLFTK